MCELNHLTTHADVQSPNVLHKNKVCQINKTGGVSSLILRIREESSFQSQLGAQTTALCMSPGIPHHHLGIRLDLNKFKLKSGAKERFLPSTWISRIQSDSQPSGNSQAFLTWLWNESFSELSNLWSALLYFHSRFFLQLERLPGIALPIKIWLIVSFWLDSHSYRRQWTGCFVLPPAENSGKESHLCVF
jgi:hypothetical protein